MRGFRRRFLRADAVLLLFLTGLSILLVTGGESLVQGARLAAGAAFFQPIERMIGVGRGFWAGGEGRDLREEAARLREENARLQDAAGENARLRAALGFRARVPGPMIPAEVIGRSGTYVEPMVLIDRGADARVEVNAPVVSVDGLVGRVVEVTGSTAWVVLLTHPECRVSGVIRRSNVVGIVAAEPGGRLALTGVPLLSDVAPGDLVVTSGEGGVFPAGWPVGEAVAMAPEFGGLLSRVDLKPAANLDLLEQVFVLGGTFGPGDARVEELAPPREAAPPAGPEPAAGQAGGLVGPRR